MTRRKNGYFAFRFFFFTETDFLFDFPMDRKILDILSYLISVEINSAKL